MFWSVLGLLLVYIVRGILILCLFWLLKELTMGICLDPQRLEGKVVLVTGGTAGIGYETALDLARRGAEVIVTSRDRERADHAAAVIRVLSDNTAVHAMRLDLASQMDVRRFAREFAARWPKLHYLVNNAGIVRELKAAHRGIADVRMDTKEDGFEVTMATNFFGPVKLTQLLLDCLREGGKEANRPGTFKSTHLRTLQHLCNFRIIFVSSIGHLSADLDVSDLNYRKKPFQCKQQYYNSKLAMILYSNELSRRLGGSNVESVSLHPGLVRTDIFHRTEDRVVQLSIFLLFWLMGKNAWQGAQTTIHAVVAAKDLNGKYMADCREVKWVVSKKVGDERLEASLYQETHSLLGLKIS